MDTFLITYQLENNTQDYALISEKIKSFSYWAKPMERVWIVKSDKKANEIRDILSEAIMKKGKIMVMNLRDNSWGTYAVSKEVTSWLKDKL